jgi:DNA-binding CsgD family transcriptional regulator
MANDKGNTEQAAERPIRAFELRKQGYSYREIGVVLGVSHKTAHEDVQRVLAELATLRQASAAEYVAMELERLDMAQQALAAHLETGDPQIVNSWVKVSESRRKLLGLDAPTKIAATNPDGTPAAYAELRSMVLTMLPMEQRLALADQLDKVIDVSNPTLDGSNTGA